MNRSARHAAEITLALALLMPTSSAWGQSQTFSKGAIIIPMESAFQTECGTLSAYGLIYRILQANAPGHFNASNPVTVYIVNNDSKSSPNRCIPTNFQNLSSTVPQPTAAAWNDGCDFAITNANEQPVVPVNYATTYSSLTGGMYPDNPIPVVTNPNNTWPTYNWTSPAITLQTTSPTSPAPPNRFTTVNYLGGPFVIDAPDVPNVIALLQSPNGDTGTGGSFTPKEALALFTNSSCTCGGVNQNIGTTNTTFNGATLSGAQISGGGSSCYYVQLHQATTNFTANVDRRINVAPPPFALFEGSAAGVLEQYLEEAGLYLSGTGSHHMDYNGCMPGDKDGCNYNGSTCVSGTECPATSVYPGNIFDDIATSKTLGDLSAAYPQGPINQKTGGRYRYQLFWAPHWDGLQSAPSNDVNGVQSITDFNQHAGGIMTECASITTYENAGPTNGVSSSGLYAPGSNFLYTNGILVGSTNSGQNGSDPYGTTVGETYVSSGNQYVTYPSPGNIFSQVGDWNYVSEGGSNPGYSPAASSAPQSYTNVMITSSNGQTAFVEGQKDAAHSTVIYISGHKVSGDPNGARTVLNSMLNLSAVPIPAERAIAAPVVCYATDGCTNATGTATDEEIAATYEDVQGYGSNPFIKTFSTPTNGSDMSLWTFPIVPGDFRIIPLSGSGALATGESAFTVSALDAAQITTSGASGIYPLPANRNLFTYFGGYPAANPTLTGGGAALNGVLQIGWVPETVAGTQLVGSPQTSPPNTTCVDVMGIPALTTTTIYDDQEPGLHLVAGSDGLCDLQEALNISKINSGNDWSASAANITQYLSDAPNAAWLFNMVRGDCYSSDVAAGSDPTDSQCYTGTFQTNRAQLGGLIHSTPAVLHPSANIKDSGASRPTVGFVGGLDGQLHAFYLGGGAGYTGPTGGVDFGYYNGAVSQGAGSGSSTDPRRDATSKFRTDWGGLPGTPFSAPQIGTELWSFLPASQIPLLATNSAQVDSSPVIQDVFVDMAGTGLREWHSVVVGSVGIYGDEIFALDVTNPLRPRLLWDVVGSLYQTGSSPTFSPTELLTNGANQEPAALVTVNKWQEPTSYFFTSPTQADPGRVETNPYDFSDLGGASELSIAETRVGNEPETYVFASTSMLSSLNGMEVFGIDVGTGQKVWQFEEPYTTGRPSSNVAPPVATAMFASAGATELMAGDQEGRLWELSSVTGANVNQAFAPIGSNVTCSATAPCAFPAFDTGSSTTSVQPISTNTATALVPSTPGPLLTGDQNDTLVIFGTAGESWAYTAQTPNPPAPNGNLHILLYNADRNAPGTTCTLPCGVLDEPAHFPIALPAGSSIFGDVTVAGQTVFFATAEGAVPSDPLAPFATVAGNTYSVDLGTVSGNSLSSQATQLSGTVGTFGGVAVYAPSGGGTVSVLGSEMTKVNRANLSGVALTDATPSPKDSTTNPPNSGANHQLREWIYRAIP